MTQHRDIDVLRALSRCTFPPRSPPKRFVRDLNAIADVDPSRITWRQWAFIRGLAWTYRRQMPAHLVPPAKPDAPPPMQVSA